MSAEFTVPTSLATDLARLAESLGSLELAEELALAERLEPMVMALRDWHSFASSVVAPWRACGHVVVRGLLNADPTAFLAASLLVGRCFKRYQRTKVVKRFTMSPWTRALSHTLDEGHFHTDLNTAPDPPRVTAIQCVVPDPSAPHAGELRIASLSALLTELHACRDERALSFLQADEVAMVSDTESSFWRGRIVEQDEIRFHPETLRAARQRLGAAPPDLEEVLARIKGAAFAASSPIHLDVGDMLLVSNRRALHYRGACTVRFRTFPRDFESRTVQVLHLLGEAA